MRNLHISIDRWIGIVAIAGTVGIATATLSLRPALQVNSTPGGVSGHPTDFSPLLQAGHPNMTAVESVMQQNIDAANALVAMIGEEPDPPDFEIPANLLAPLASGEYVNFESPAINPIAVSANGFHPLTQLVFIQ